MGMALALLSAKNPVSCHPEPIYLATFIASVSKKSLEEK
jgi:hypothetical protein